MKRLAQWFLRLPWLLAAAIALTACTPAALSVVNQHQTQAGLASLSAGEAVDLYCRHGVDAAVAYFGPTRWGRILDASDGPPDCPKPPPIPLHEQWPWQQLAFCESGGNWAINTGNGYYGGLQFALTSWRGVGGTGYPHQHSAAEQIYRAQRLQAIQGWNAWPSCARQIGLL